MAWIPAKHTSWGVQVLVEVHLDVDMARVKKQDGLVKGHETFALSSNHCFPAVLVRAVRVQCHLMKLNRAFACALFVSVRLKMD